MTQSWRHDVVIESDTQVAATYPKNLATSIALPGRPFFVIEPNLVVVSGM